MNLVLFLIAAGSEAPPQLPEWALPAVVAVAGLGVLLLVFALLGRRGQDSAPPEKPNIALPREAARDGKGDERRRWPRRGGNPTRVLLSSNKGRGEQSEGLVVDRSLGGICLLMNKQVPRGTTLSVRAVHAPEHVGWVEIKAVYVREVGERWQVGCQFVGTPPLSVVLLFG
jgi:hypothetical protein